VDRRHRFFWHEMISDGASQALASIERLRCVRAAVRLAEEVET
jgi:hypothetical protein